ncbi:peptidylprolyl isomerase [Polynucleobacter sphagniphilus]|jgi:peptidyl-prolyl cis-trans isomerase C|uniref:peptidylprolyl isomerase n=1 Tax=Polynucleobacter sphagniphilus TaxID=1743169 RepID=UPI002475E997|nr:peptidylprolyl isomerase [Polynucleobacter sphagniphilus]MDH6300757.1 peptidyl-prolyl cis-trans isomerase C [Polynucleobacter sphagniphilus]
MKKLLKNLLLLGTILIISENVLSQSAGAPVATVNGVAITNGQLNDWVKSAVMDGAQDTPQLRQSILNDLVLRELILKDVKKTGLLKQGNNEFKVKLAEQNAILDVWFNAYLKSHPVTEAEVKAEYDRQVALSKEPANAKEYQVSQIVVGTEAEGVALIKQIRSPANFAALAKEKSLDKATSEQGGLVGWALPSQLMAPINQVVLTLNKGQVYDKPVQTQVGWHVIEINDIRPVVVPSFDQAKENIARALIQQRRQQAISGLLQTSKVVKN